MPSKPVKSNATQSNAAAPMDYETLLRLVYARVLVLWQDDLRRNRERGGKILRR